MKENCEKAKVKQVEAQNIRSDERRTVSQDNEAKKEASKEKEKQRMEQLKITLASRSFFYTRNIMGIRVYSQGSQVLTLVNNCWNY